MSHSLHLGYNTNGFANHRLPDALSILADLGYDSVALTLDHACLDPFAIDFRQQLENARKLLDRLKLRPTIETGARFLLDPRRKHRPTLLSPAGKRDRRLEFLKLAIIAARDLGANVVSFWSGTSLVVEPDEVLWARLVDGCRELADYAADRSVRLAFEPEPGMWIDTTDRWAKLERRVNHPAFGLTIDIGHLHCLGETPIAPVLERWRHRLWNIHIDDMRKGIHDHLFFGEGEIDFPPILATLSKMQFAGSIHVELSRHSHDAVETARKALDFLRRAQRGCS